MSDDEYERKLKELDRLLNDPDVAMQPARIWSLLAELSARDESVGAVAAPTGAPRVQAQQAAGD